MATAKLEFDVQLSCESCVNTVKQSFSNVEGVQNVSVDLQHQQVIVETSLPSSEIQRMIESTGRKAILKGLGSSTSGMANLGAAVAALNGLHNSVMGVIRFLQVQENNCIIDGTIDGLTPGEHGLHIYEYGDLTDNCSNLGGHYNPTGSKHGGPGDEGKHVGDLGNILASNNGRATFRLENDSVKVYDIIGRSVGVSSDRDDYGKGSSAHSKETGNCGSRVACGIIARSAGLFENPKRLCQCSGNTVWEEREHVLAQQQAKI